MKRLILVRHGQSTYNVSHQFTGWDDAPLTETGLQQAAHAGTLLKEAGYFPQRVFVSQLKRAQQTLQQLLQNLGLPTLPYQTDWRLNERHYGDFQGRTRQECAQIYGMEQVLLCRQTYRTTPPSRLNNTAAEELLPEGRVPPNGESVQTCMERCIPFLKQEVFPQFEQAGTILLVAHEDLLRGLVKHLKKQTEQDFEKQVIPPATPWIFELGESLFSNKDYLLGDPEEIRRFLKKRPL